MKISSNNILIAGGLGIAVASASQAAHAFIRMN
jgi:hypothetical protein